MSVSALEVVKMIIGMFLRSSFSFIYLRTSRPSFFGKFKSKITISGSVEPKN
jgi:hypothetical protein